MTLVVLLAALLACGSGSSNACDVRVQRNGSAASGKGTDRFAARNTACRAWCKANDAESAKDSFFLARCASQCGADVIFGTSSEKVSCK